MSSPNFVFRLPPADRKSLDLVAKIYGSKSSGSFLTEMVRAFCSGDPRLAAAFNTRLMQKAGEQLQLQFVNKMENELKEVKASVMAQTVPAAAKQREKGGRRAKQPK